MRLSRQIAKNTYQQGRTMVEMLIVLAIIGVLSVGSVVGYHQAMASKKANDVVKYLSSVSLEVSQQPGLVTNQRCEDYNKGRYSKPSWMSDCHVTFNPAKGVYLTVEYDERTLSGPVIAALESRCSDQIYSTKVNNKTQKFVWGDLTHKCGQELLDDPLDSSSTWTGGGNDSQDNSCELFQSIQGCVCSGYTVEVKWRY